MIGPILFAAALAAPVIEARSEAPPPAVEPINRAGANYEAILRGEKSFAQLTPTEQDEIRELDRRIRAQQPPDTRTTYEKCLDAEYARLGREPSELDQRVIATRCR